MTLGTGIVGNSQYYSLVLWQLGVPSVMPPVSSLSFLATYVLCLQLQGISHTILDVFNTESPS